VLAHGDDFRRDQVEVIEEPLGSGGDKNAIAGVFGQRAIGAQQHRRVVAKARKYIARPAACGINREIRC
jgi:hypothetical protein